MKKQKTILYDKTEEELKTALDETFAKHFDTSEKVKKLEDDLTSYVNALDSYPTEYQKKPVKVRAIRLLPNNIRRVHEFANLSIPPQDCPLTVQQMYYDQIIKGGLKIETLEGTMTANIGDYIIEGVKGEVYPCKPDIFKATYEHVLLENEAHH